MIYIIPTDTCYGLAGSYDEVAYEQIYSIKHRDISKPLAILVKNFEDLPKYINISEEQIDILRAYPHPWSCLAERTMNAPLPGKLIDDPKYQKISLRVAEVCISETIRDTLPYPLFLTSANHSGEMEAHTLEDAKSIVHDSKIEMQSFDGGICDKPGSNIFEFMK
ncbi:Sua5/YciO/YrdC/YwlC family protein [Candidatus Peregrinibacteria bacterium]|nr:Sua5/YciO/YrdC/YwlC family protein [Candidatus Peregrinibacteria bacterium]MCB9804729.1 Sua5/YciO/YrdC/YwlC family protein [Candidatus Peribacteria bacterium]